MIPHLHTQLCSTPHDEVCTRGECIYISKCNPNRRGATSMGRETRTCQHCGHRELADEYLGRCENCGGQ